jgi:hypothetical protein
MDSSNDSVGIDVPESLQSRKEGAHPCRRYSGQQFLSQALNGETIGLEQIDDAPGTSSTTTPCSDATMSTSDASPESRAARKVLRMSPDKVLTMSPAVHVSTSLRAVL